VYELDIAKGELVSFPTRVFVQASSIPEISAAVAQSLQLADAFGKPLELEMTCDEDYVLVTSMAQLQVRTILAVWSKGSKLRAELEAAAADPSKKGPKLRDPKQIAYSTVGETTAATAAAATSTSEPSAATMSTGGQLSPDVTLQPEPEPEPAGGGSGSAAATAATADAAQSDSAALSVVGARVEVYSRSMQKWMRGTVASLEGEGAIKVKYADSEHAGEKLVHAGNVAEVRPLAVTRYAVGAQVMIFSRSLGKWVHGEVLAIETNVIYGDASGAQRTKCVDPADADSVKRCVSHVVAAEPGWLSAASQPALRLRFGSTPL
jgi:hypothetical protein